jgi:hypothetical protein
MANDLENKFDKKSREKSIHNQIRVKKREIMDLRVISMNFNDVFKEKRHE